MISFVATWSRAGAHQQKRRPALGQPVKGWFFHSKTNKNGGNFLANRSGGGYVKKTDLNQLGASCRVSCCPLCSFILFDCCCGVASLRQRGLTASSPRRRAGGG
jgi:hypothetical protein